MTNPEPEPAWSEPAMQAMVAAVNSDPQAAGDAIKTLIHLGGDACTLALVLWMDATARQMGAPRGGVPGMSVTLAFHNTHTDQLEDAEHVADPRIVWAGRLFAARVARDEETCVALMQAVPGPEQLAHLVTMLECLAVTWRSGQRMYLVPAARL
jgi:hypothetical protein